MKKLLFPVFAISLLFASCSKEDKCELNNASLQGSYKLTSLKYKSSASASEIDVFQGWDACAKDDVYIFAANNVFTYQDAGAACSSPSGFTDTWVLAGSSLSYDGDLYTVSSFNCNNMVLTRNNVFASGDVGVFTFVKL